MATGELELSRSFPLLIYPIPYVAMSFREGYRTESMRFALCEVSGIHGTAVEDCLSVAAVAIPFHAFKLSPSGLGTYKNR
jgi:hypothetical protein